ncbi:hypothetical protein [Nonomuraea basaltis]|uniref:hypothetical protein n=1 Tax=Nonomuraea basaltis TaxID=2495887 RepID=UPI00148672D1|nr:hypothetical protein [Nonomuraea basaltis]
MAWLLAHELAHALVAKRHDIEAVSVTLWALGGVTEFRRWPPVRAVQAGPGRTGGGSMPGSAIRADPAWCSTRPRRRGR